MRVLFEFQGGCPVRSLLQQTWISSFYRAVPAWPTRNTWITRLSYDRQPIRRCCSDGARKAANGKVDDRQRPIAVSAMQQIQIIYQIRFGNLKLLVLSRSGQPRHFLWRVMSAQSRSAPKLCQRPSFRRKLNCWLSDGCLGPRLGLQATGLGCFRLAHTADLSMTKRSPQSVMRWQTATDLRISVSKTLDILKI